MSEWPRGALEVLGGLDHHRRSRSELIVLCGIDDSDWMPAISFLVESGMAIRSGTRRGTRYQRAPDNHRAPSGPAHSHVRASVALGYHNLIGDIIRELNGETVGCDETERPRNPDCDEEDG